MIDPNTVRFLVEVPNNQYFSIGFGPTMFGCDEVVWEANGQNSAAYDLWSIDYRTPSIDPHQDYTTTYVYNGTHVTFTSDRVLNTGDNLDFIIPTVSAI